MNALGKKELYVHSSTYKEQPTKTKFLGVFLKKFFQTLSYLFIHSVVSLFMHEYSYDMEA